MAEDKFVFDLPDYENINHVVVFMLGTIPFLSVEWEALSTFPILIQMECCMATPRFVTNGETKCHLQNFRS